MAGLAQKGGAVYSHIRIANQAPKTFTPSASLPAAPISSSVATWSSRAPRKVLSAFKPGTNVVLNSFEYMPGDFTRNPDFSLPLERIKRAIATAAGHDLRHVLDATKIATELLGKSIGGNMLMIGYCYQIGALPSVGGARSNARSRLNGEEVPMNHCGLPLWPPRRRPTPAAIEYA